MALNIVMLNGQNHWGSTYRIGRMIADKISGDNELREFFFPKDLNHFCMGSYRCIEDEKIGVISHRNGVVNGVIDCS